MSTNLVKRDAALTPERALRTAAVVRPKTMELDAALAAEQSLKKIAGSSTEQDAEHMTTVYLAVALGGDYLAGDTELFTEAATQSGVTMQQLQHTPGVKTLGDDGEPPGSELSVVIDVALEQNCSKSHPRR